MLIGNLSKFGFRHENSTEFNLTGFATTAGYDNFSVTINLQATLDAVPGNDNDDGVVNAADYSVWRDSLGQTGVALPADGNHYGAIDASDHTVWVNNFGRTAPASLSGTVVPEPSAILMALFTCLILPRLVSGGQNAQELLARSYELCLATVVHAAGNYVARRPRFGGQLPEQDGDD